MKAALPISTCAHCGTPKAARDANRAGRMDAFHRIYMARFSQPEAQLALLEAEDLCRTTPPRCSDSAATS